MYQTKLDRALVVSATVHVRQVRKGANIPYIVHPVSVMLIASQVTDDEDTLCACLLHDVLEDGDPNFYGEAQMRRDFGPKVTATVKAVSKNEAIPGWRARNDDYLQTLRDSDNPAAYIVCAADKIHNLKSVLYDFDQLGDDLWSRFNAGKDQQKWWYRAALTLLEDKLPDNQLVTELAGLVARLEEI